MVKGMRLEYLLKYRRKLMKFQNAYAVTIPIELIRSLKLKRGDYVEMYLLPDASLLIKFKGDNYENY